MRGEVIQIFNLFKDDRVLCDAEMNMFSLNASHQKSQANPDGVFELCSDRLARKFPTYELDEICRFKPGPDAERINFNDFKELLLSKDMSHYELL